MRQLSLRNKIWDLASRNHPQGTILPPLLVLLSAILWPKIAILSWLHKDCGYNIFTNSWTINGVEFDNKFFQAFSKETPKGCCFIVQQDANVFNGKPLIHGYYCNLVSNPFTGEKFVNIDTKLANDFLDT